MFKQRETLRIKNIFWNPLKILKVWVYLGHDGLHSVFADGFFVLEIFGEVAQGHDSRVRHVVVDALHELHQRGDPIQITKRTSQPQGNLDNL